MLDFSFIFYECMPGRKVRTPLSTCYRCYHKYHQRTGCALIVHHLGPSYRLSFIFDDMVHFCEETQTDCSFDCSFDLKVGGRLPREEIRRVSCFPVNPSDELTMIEL